MSEERKYRPRFNKRSNKEFAHNFSAERTRASKRDKEDIPHTTSKGTGVKRTTSLQSQKESLRAANLNTVASALESSSQSSHQRIEEARNKITRAQADIEYLQFLLQMTTDSRPWSTKSQYTELLRTQKEAYSRIESKIRMEHPEMANRVREDLRKITRLNKTPSRQKAKWHKLRIYLSEHKCRVDIGPYQPNEISAFYAEVREINTLLAEAKSDLEIARTLLAQAQSQQPVSQARRNPIPATIHSTDCSTMECQKQIHLIPAILAHCQYAEAHMKPLPARPLRMLNLSNLLNFMILQLVNTWPL